MMTRYLDSLMSFLGRSVYLLSLGIMAAFVVQKLTSIERALLPKCQSVPTALPSPVFDENGIRVEASQ